MIIRIIWVTASCMRRERCPTRVKQRQLFDNWLTGPLNCLWVGCDEREREVMTVMEALVTMTKEENFGDCAPMTPLSQPML